MASAPSPGPERRLTGRCPNECSGMTWSFEGRVSVRFIPESHRYCPACGARMEYTSEFVD